MFLWPAVRNTSVTILGPALLLLLSLLVFHHATIFTGFALTPGELGDSMLLNYVLEHDYRWLTFDKLHHSLWSPPIFYPQQDTAVYTDLMLGALPPYALWRIIGVEPLTAFQLWLLTVSVLNFVAAYWLLHRILGCGWIASSGGAILLAFGSPRLVQFGHPQLTPAFYIVIAFAGVCLLFRAATSREVYTALALMVGGFCIQSYTAFYYAWFMAFTASLALVFALLLPAPRAALFLLLRRWWTACLPATLLAAVALGPYAGVAWNVLKQVGGRSFDEVRLYLPTTKTWFSEGPDHLLYGGLHRMIASGFAAHSAELYDGIGFFTTALVIAGFVLFRRRPIVQLWGLAGLALILLTFLWPGNLSLWFYVYSWFPGALAIRSVSRFSVFLLLPASIALAYLLDRVNARYSPAWAIACVLAVGLEQAGTLHRAPNYSKAQTRASIELVARQVHPDCRTLLFSWNRGGTSPEIMHIMGMWAELFTGVPTLNGYSGQFPPHWPLSDVAIANMAERDQVLEEIELWIDEHPADFDQRTGNVCWVLPESASTVIWRVASQGK